MEKRIELEKRHRSPDKVTELNLDNCKGCTAVEGLTDEFVNLHTLSLIGSGLTSLKGFPKLPKLKKLELSDNKISGGLQILKDCEKLSSLNLSGNRIKDLATLQDLKELQNLRVLDLFNNDITTTTDYRNKVFELLPQLIYLDGSDKNGKEYEESDEEEDDDEEEEEEGNGEVKMNGNSGASQSDDDDDDDDLEEEELGEEEESDDDEEVGLKDIYNDNLEDDESDVYEEGEEEEEDHDISDESDGEGGNSSRLSANNSLSASPGAAGQSSKSSAADKADSSSSSSGAAASSAAASRGTKRKLEDDGEQDGN